MSSKYDDICEQLKALIVGAGIGWAENKVLIESVGDLWNPAATALAAAGAPCVLVIGVVEGQPQQKGGLNIETTFALTILSNPAPIEGKHPLGQMWEDLICYVHNLRLQPTDHALTKFEFAGWQPVAAERNGSSLIGRATTFTRRTQFSSKHHV